MLFLHTFFLFFNKGASQEEKKYVSAPYIPAVSEELIQF